MVGAIVVVVETSVVVEVPPSVVQVAAAAVVLDCVPVVVQATAVVEVAAVGDVPVVEGHAAFGHPHGAGW